MDYTTPKTPSKPLKKVVKGLAYAVLRAGLALHTIEFVGGLIVLNQIESGGIEATIDVQDEAMEIKTDKETAIYLADKIISEVNEPWGYLFVSGFKLAALTYKAKN